jgi:CHAT domain-containing protein
LGERSNDERLPSLQHLLAWEAWLTQWTAGYDSYKAAEDPKNHPWRFEMERHLQRLQAILGLDEIVGRLRERGIECLILIPHRDLHRLPLHFLLPDFTCTYLPSAYWGLSSHTSHTSHTPPTSHPHLLLIENPKSTPDVAGDKKTLADLPFAEVEAALVAQLFPHTNPIAGDSATNATITAALAQPHHCFHFTGHGAYDSSNPSQSCLFLQGSDRLTLRDIIQLDLGNYYLVTLAACETGVTGDFTITDEYVGLASAFLKAGVSHVLSTLWTVPDSAASVILLMEFYQQLRADSSPAAALKAAQTWLKNATRQQVLDRLEEARTRLAGDRSLQVPLESETRRIINEAIDFPYGEPYYWASFAIAGKIGFPDVLK